MKSEVPQRPAEELDYSTLAWVRDEIGRSLELTQQTLRTFAEDSSDKSPLRFCVTYLHQIYGTLHMVEIHGAALLAEEMEKTASALFRGETHKVDEALDSLMRTSLQLPAYLDNLQQGHADIPAVLTPLINDLRIARGDTLLTDNAFFNPDLDISPPAIATSAQQRPADIQTHARKLRAVFQAALLSWLRDKEGEASLKKLGVVLRQLWAYTDSDDARRVWWIMAGLVEALRDDGLAAGASVNMLLGQIDAEIKRLIHHGESVFSEAPPRKLLKSALYQLGRADSQGPVVSAIKTAFRLEELVPQRANFEQAMDALKGSSQEILHKATEIIQSELQETVEELNRHQHDREEDITQLEPCLEIIKHSADTLTMLGQPALSTQLREQADLLQRAMQRGERLTDEQLMALAGSLAYVDSALSHGVEQGETIPAQDQTETVLLPRAELREIHHQVYKESLALLSFVKAALNGLELDPDNSTEVPGIPDKLLQLRSTLAFMGLDRPACLLVPISRFIDQQLIRGEGSPSPEQLDTLADAITSIEFYFEALVDDRKRPEAILTVAEISIEQLGYTSQQADLLEEGDEAQASLEEPAADTEAASASMADAELLQVFTEEAEGLAAHINTALSAWQQDFANRGALDELRRSCHTLKGSAYLAGVRDLAEVAASVDGLLGMLQKQSLLPSPAALELFQQLPALLDDTIASLAQPESDSPVVKTFCDRARYLTAAAGSTSIQAMKLPSQEPASEEHPADHDKTDPYLAFREEALGHIRQIRDFLQVHEEADEATISESLLQAVNTLPDSARMAHADAIVQISEPMDQLLHNYHLQQQTLDGEAMLTLGNFTDTAEALIQQLGGGTDQSLDYSHLLQDITLLQEHLAETGSSATADASLDSEVENEPLYDTDMLAIFLEEAEELQEKIDAALQDWAEQPQRLEVVSRLQRALHTLKGSARMANVTAIGDLAHAMESVLEGIIGKRFTPHAEHTRLMQRCHDWLVRALEKARQLEIVEAASELLDQIDATIARAKKPHQQPSAPTRKNDSPDEDPSHDLNEIIEFIETFSYDAEQENKTPQKPPVKQEEQIRVPVETLNQLIDETGEINIFNARIARQLKDWQFNMGELQQTIERLRAQLRQFEMEAETQILFRQEPSEDSHKDFDPLELDRFSNMQQLSRSMVESLSDLASIENILSNLGQSGQTLLEQQQHLTSQHQEHLMHARLVSFSSILPRLRRVVRQTSNETGKFAELVVTGTEAELDRVQLGHIVTILEHLLRNAIDHGIESPDKRDRLGKQRVGQIHLDYQHQGTEIVLKLSDDGAGFNIAELRDMAISRGLVEEDTALSDQEILNFIFEAGFTTAPNLTQISGRGVGLDVVSNEVKQLGGSVRMDSSAGQGASFTLRLPLTLLINQAILVRATDTIYAIQLPHVEHIVRVDHGELAPLQNAEESVFAYDGQDYRYLDLCQLLHGQPAALPKDPQRMALLLLRSGEQRIALHVDESLGRQDMVIKPVGPQLSSEGLLAGASVLPDGEVALILDLANLIRSAENNPDQDTAPTAKLPSAPVIMVVDDSITVRKVTARLLERYAYQTITAKDGEEALEILNEQRPDLLLVDVEMPRMDGFELAEAIRHNPQLQDLPVIMITSRSGEKHRQRAMEIGVNQYMGKPFQEKELIANIRQLIPDHEC